MFPIFVSNLCLCAYDAAYQEREKILERIYPRLTDRLSKSIWNQYFGFEDTKNSKKKSVTKNCSDLSRFE